MTTMKVMIFGSGSLARSVCCSLPSVVSEKVDIWIVARSLERAEEVAYLVATRAAISGASTQCHALACDLTSVSKITEIIDWVRPAVLLACASHQSPWESLTAPSAWTQLIEKGGFGLTLPLQVQLAANVSRALADTTCCAPLVNTSFPDAVNPTLAALGLPILCGVGNVGLIAATLRHALGLPNRQALQVLAHHVHLRPPIDATHEALAWADGVPVPDVTALLAAQRKASRPLLNLVTGHVAAHLVADLLSGAEVTTSVPGPLGLPGGYPVRLVAGTIELDLPVGLARTDAISWNRRAALRDGVDLDGSQVCFAPDAQEALATHLPDVAAGFSVDEISSVCDRMLALRARLRRVSVSPHRKSREVVS